jgi:hypothetical protein
MITVAIRQYHNFALYVRPAWACLVSFHYRLDALYSNPVFYVRVRDNTDHLPSVILVKVSFQMEFGSQTAARAAENRGKAPEIFQNFFLNAGKHVHETGWVGYPIDNRTGQSPVTVEKTVPSFVPTTKPY